MAALGGWLVKQRLQHKFATHLPFSCIGACVRADVCLSLCISTSSIRLAKTWRGSQKGGTNECKSSEVARQEILVGREAVAVDCTVGPDVRGKAGDCVWRAPFFPRKASQRGRFRGASFHKNALSPKGLHSAFCWLRPFAERGQCKLANCSRGQPTSRQASKQTVSLA